MANFPDQERRLARSLRVLGDAMLGDMAAVRHLASRAESHDRQHLNIRPHLYEIWRETLIATAAEHDPEWSTDVAECWNVVLIHAIHYMTHRY